MICEIRVLPWFTFLIKMDEIKRIVDDITIMREMVHVETWPAAEMTTEDIITKMVDERPMYIRKERIKPGSGHGSKVLSMRNHSRMYLHTPQR